MATATAPSRVKNRDIYSYTEGADADLTDVDGNIIGIVVGAGTIVDVKAEFVTAPTTDSADLDVNVNGTSIFGATKIVAAATSTTGTVPALTTTAVSDGDIITFDVDALDTGNAAKGLFVQVIVE